MIAKRKTSSLRTPFSALRRSHTHVLPSPSSLLLLLLVAATCCMFGSVDTFGVLAFSTPARRTQSFSTMPVMATSSRSISADASSPTEAADDYLASSSSSADLNVLQPTPADLVLHNWCTQTAGIALSPSIQICTTPHSVAGRGLFAAHDVEKGEVLALIPREVVLGVDNCRDQMGSVDGQVEEDVMSMNSKNKSGRKRRWIKHVLSKLSFRRRGGNSRTSRSSESTSEITDETTMWAPILTKYALQAKASKHPWSEWIEQWNRCDPMHDAYLKMGPILKIVGNGSPEHQMMMEELIGDTATKIQEMMPHIDEKYLQAAISIRLSRLEAHFRLLGFADDDNIDMDEALRLYSLITSRAIELDSDTTAVLPFYDLANHNLDPNLGLEFVENDGDNDGNANGVESAGFYSIFARRDIVAGSELFFRYTKFDEAMDSNAAMWAAINWGIPHYEEQYEERE